MTRRFSSRRLRGGPIAEKEKAQKVIMLLASLGFIASLVLPALDRRFLSSSVPTCSITAGDVLMAVSFFIIFRVYSENAFASATIDIAEDQRVISTGLYAIVRHPMYAGRIALAQTKLWGSASSGGPEGRYS